MFKTNFEQLHFVQKQKMQKHEDFSSGLEMVELLKMTPIDDTPVVEVPKARFCSTIKEKSAITLEVENLLLGLYFCDGDWRLEAVLKADQSNNSELSSFLKAPCLTVELCRVSPI